MEFYNTKVIINKTTSKKIKQSITSPFEKNMYLICFGILIFLLPFFIISENLRITVNIILLLLVLLFARFIGGPNVKFFMLIWRISELRHQKDIQKEYTLTASFNETGYVLKDAEYGDKVVTIIEYNKIRWFIETKTHYIIMPKSLSGLPLYGWLEWFNLFGVISNAEIENTSSKNELIEFLKCRCDKIKFVMA